MTLVWIVFGVMAAYLAYGFVVPNPHRRVFADGLPEDNVKNGYLAPQEVFDPDEDAIAKRVSEAFAAQTKRHKQFIGRDDPAFHEPLGGIPTGFCAVPFGSTGSKTCPRNSVPASSNKTAPIPPSHEAGWRKTRILVSR